MELVDNWLKAAIQELHGGSFFQEFKLSGTVTANYFR